MTLVRRESFPVSEAQTIIRSHYLRPWPTIAGFRREPTTVTQEVVVVGCGVNYDANRGAGRPVWVASQDSLQLAAQPDAAFECTAGPIEMRLPNDAASPLVLGKNGTHVACSLLGATGVRAEKKNDRTALYRNALPDTDLEWKVGKGFLKETLIVRSRNAPAAFSFALRADAGTKFLVPTRTAGTFGYRDLLAAATAGRPERVDGSVLISREGGTTRGLMRMSPATVRDADGHTTAMLATFLRATDGSLLYTIAVPPGFWSAPERKFPLAVDPTFINVPNEEYPYLYEAGKTYYIASPVGYGYPTVIVEANAVLKFGPEDCYLCFQRLYESEPEPMLRVQGTPYNYAIFTSGYDDSVGADTDGTSLPLQENPPGAGAYDYAINFWSSYWGTMNEVEINYAKFAYAGRQNPYSPYPGAAILMAGPNMEGNETIGGSVSNCVFESNLKALVLLDGYYRPLHLTVRNCLFLGSQFGIYFDGKYLELDVRNCTFDGRGGDTAIWLNGREGGYAVATMVNNVFAHYATGVYANGYCSVELDYFGVYDVENYGLGFDYGTNHFAPYGYESPFEPNANGSYYLKDLFNHYDFRDKGSCTAESAGLAGKATRAATVANGRVKRNDITQSETWTRFEEQFDTGQLDLGYHYDPVDIIVKPSFVPYQFADLRVTGSATTLWINPGVVVAFAADITYGNENVSQMARILVQNGANLDAQGTGPQPIAFTSTAASGDRIGHPCNDPSGVIHWYHTAIELATGFGAKTRIRYCNFSHMMLGIGMGATPPATTLDINNCRFGFGNAGVGVNLMQTGVTSVLIWNCLFHHLAAEGIVADSPSIYSFISVRNCSFDRLTWGVLLADIAPAEILNCIFQNFSWAIDAVHWEPYYTSHTYNCFSVEPTNFVLNGSEKFGDPGFDPGSPAVADHAERYYLNQSNVRCVNTGDPAIGCYQTTARDLSLDYGGNAGSQNRAVDMGFHYPVKGYLKVSPNGRYFENEDGTAFIPIGGNEQNAWINVIADCWCLPANSAKQAALEAYLEFLRQKGTNMIKMFIESATFPPLAARQANAVGPMYFEQIITNPDDPISVESNVKQFWKVFAEKAAQKGIRLILSPYESYHVVGSASHANEGVNLNKMFYGWGEYGSRPLLCNPYYTLFTDQSEESPYCIENQPWPDSVDDRLHPGRVDTDNLTPELAAELVHILPDWLKVGDAYNAWKWHKRRVKFWVSPPEGDPAGWVGVSENPSILWELMNEINYIGPGGFDETISGDRSGWVTALGSFVRTEDMARSGRSHLLCVSVSYPAAAYGQQYLYGVTDQVKFTENHFYAANSGYGYIGDYTLEHGRGMASYVKDSLNHQIPQSPPATHPYLNTEWHPHAWVGQFADPEVAFPQSFDRQYFFRILDMTLCHMCAGGCGTGMVWPYRIAKDTQGNFVAPYCGTFNGINFWGHGVSRAVRQMQFLLSEILKRSGINFGNFPHFNVDDLGWVLTTEDTEGSFGLYPINDAHPVALFSTGCMDKRQALIYISRDRSWAFADAIASTQITTNLLAGMTVVGLHEGTYIFDVWEPWITRQAQPRSLLEYDIIGENDPFPFNVEDFHVGRYEVEAADLGGYTAATLLSVPIRKCLFVMVWPK